MSGGAATAPPLVVGSCREYAPRDVRRYLLVCQILLLGAGPFVSAVTGARFFSTAYSAAAAHATLSGPARALSIGVNQGAAVLGLAALFSVLPCLAFDRRKNGMFLGCVLVSAVALTAAIVNVPRASAVSPFVRLSFLGVLFLLPGTDPEWLKRWFRRVLRFYAVGSLMAALFWSAWAVEHYAGSVLPWTPIRLHGLAPHANILAPMMLVLLVLELCVRTRSRWDVAWMFAAVAVLLLCQSRTTWLAGGAILLVESFRRSGRDSRRSARGGFYLLLSAACLLIALLEPGISGFTDGPVAPAGFGTVRGRMDVWNVTLDLWRQSPIFGYGLELWGPNMRLAFLGRLGWAPPTSHNQFVQTLGETGLIGAAALTIYVLQWGLHSVRLAAASGGVTLALFVLFTFRSVTEVPLRFNISDGNFLLEYIAVALVMASLGRSPQHHGVQSEVRNEGLAAR